MNTNFRLSGEETERLLARYAATGDRAARDRAVEGNLYIAEIVARRFAGRGVDYDDLFQTAALALVRSAERYDPARGVRFVSYATPSMVGEVRNYFRDRYRLIRTPRRATEQARLVRATMEALCHELGRYPRADELAERAGLTEDEVLEAPESSSMQPLSLDAEPREGERGVAETLGAEDAGFLHFENADRLRGPMEKLTERQRRVIRLRFFEGLSQREIARREGTNQMSISRTERAALALLRREIDPESDERS